MGWPQQRGHLRRRRHRSKDRRSLWQPGVSPVAVRYGPRSRWGVVALGAGFQTQLTPMTITAGDGERGHDPQPRDDWQPHDLG
jgi:hypothetical protein